MWVTWRAADHSLETAVIIRRCAEDDGLDEESLVAMGFLVSTNDAEAPAARVAPTQYNLMTTVQVAASKEQRAEWWGAGQIVQIDGILQGDADVF